MNRKKQRGQYRKLKSMVQSIDSFVPFFNTEKPFEHFHVPSIPFREHNKTSRKVKTTFCKKWLETTEQFIAQKSTKTDFCKVVAVLSVPNYWSSQIIIFYDESYYNFFWSRKGEGQIWKLEKDKASFCKEHNIITSLPEACYHETLIEDDQVLECDLWFYGDIPFI